MLEREMRHVLISDIGRYQLRSMIEGQSDDLTSWAFVIPVRHNQTDSADEIRVNHLISCVCVGTVREVQEINNTTRMLQSDIQHNSRG